MAARTTKKTTTRQQPVSMPVPASPTVTTTNHTQNGTTNGKPVGVKNRMAETIRETEVLQSVAGLNLDSVSGTLASTQVEVQKSLAGLSARLVEQLQVLRNVEDAIGLKRDELKQLYDLEAGAIELDELEARIQTQREEWDAEQARKQREFGEQQTERNKLWHRQEEEYQYRIKQDRLKVEDDFQFRMLMQERTAKEKQEQLEKDWTVREDGLKKREQELADLRQQVAGIPELVKKAEATAAAIAGNSVKKEYETKIALANKDVETAQKLAQAEVTALKQALDRANSQVADIKAQLEQAHRDMKEISAKALESASGRSAMEALQKVLEKEPTKSSK